MPPTKKKRAKSTKVTVNKNQHLHEVGDESDNDMGMWLERGDHPLLNDVVLKNLFGYVKPKDLKACRLVCKKWTNLSLPSARSKYQVTIREEDPPGFNSGVNIPNFIDLFGSNNSPGIPFTEFRIGSFDPTFEAWNQFIHLCGEMMTKLDLSFCGDVYSIRNIAQLLRSAPNLQYFEMPRIREFGLRSCREVVKLFPGPCEPPSLKYLKTLYCGWTEDYIKVCPTLFVELLRAAENISSLLTYNTNPVAGLKLLKTLEKIGRESRIESLSLHEINTDILNRLRKMFKKPEGLKLKHLSVSYGSLLPIMTSYWVPLVELMKESLVSLRIHDNCSIPTHFPRMPQLKLLELGICVLPGSTEVINIWDFNNSFPALQSLQLNSKDQVLDEFFIGSECCPLMESLNLGKCKLILKTFQQTLDILPNLKELELKITEDGAYILQKIWTEMSGLEKLNIYGRLQTEDIESLMTGFSIEEIEIIRKKLNTLTLKEMTMEVRRQTILELIQRYDASRPSIRNLTNLRHLTLNMTGRAGKKTSYLGDLTGYFCIYALTNLRRMSISDCMFSNTCSEILPADMDLQSWSIQRPGKRLIHHPTRYEIPKSVTASQFKYSESSKGVLRRSNLIHD